MRIAAISIPGTILSQLDISKLNLLGAHQLVNAGLGIHLAKNILKDAFDTEVTQKALTNCQWPGRLQKIKSGVLTGKIKKFKPYITKKIYIVF